MKSLNPLNTIDPMVWFLGDEDVKERLAKVSRIVSQTKNKKVIQQIFYETLEPIQDRLPWPFKVLFYSGRLSPKLLAKELDFGFRLFAGRFIAGNDIPSIAKGINAYHKMGSTGSAANIDVLGDAVLSEKEAEEYVAYYMHVFQELPRYLLPGVDVSASIKISAAFSQISPTRPEYSADVICERFDPFFAYMHKRGSHIYLDALEKDYREIQLLVFKRFYRKYGDTAANVLQSYFIDSADIQEELIREKADVGAELLNRLVMGAYHLFEQLTAELRNWQTPVHLKKENTVRNFCELWLRGIAGGLSMISGTNNARLLVFALRNGAKEIQLIFGMGEPYAEVLNHYHVPNRFYRPILLTKSYAQGIGYLLRRVEDITGIESYLRMLYYHRNEELNMFEKGIKDFVQHGGLQ
ncbi:MAG: proline dehydrogenase family protein [Candidatus Niyogibacteria bacterium]|nr:proline dehydrogenase family protein [Candidatus Niyogibacteria bacterium]